jgi:adenylate kinase
MARGELVPDDMVVAIVGDRIEEPDAHKGFILDGFPRTVPQAAALDRMLANKGLKLDAVIELRVDEQALLKRIESRVAQMQARGEPLRQDDSPEVLHRRILAYRDLTTPLVTYYKLQSVLRTVDGMVSIPDVAAAIDQALAPPKPRAKPVPANKPAPADRSLPANKPAAAGKPVKKPARPAAKAAESRKPARKPAAKGAGGNKAQAARKAPSGRPGSAKSAKNKGKQGKSAKSGKRNTRNR